jgi:hypothetical protein
MASTMVNNSAADADLIKLREPFKTDNDDELVVRLSNYTGDINVAFDDDYSNTLLHLAIKSGSLKCVKVLLDRGAKICVINRSQNTPLHYAAQSSSFKSVKLLVDYISRSSSHDLKTEVNSTNSNRRTPVHLAAQSGSLECMKLLVKNESILSMRDEIGNTPLHYAAMSGFTESIRYLIKHGANLLVTNNEKKTPLYIILNNVPDGEDLLRYILDESIEQNILSDGKEKLRVSLRVLCPNTLNKMAVANRLYSHHRENKKLLLHPLLKTLIYLEWDKFRYLMRYRVLVYLLYLVALTVFISLSTDSNLSKTIRYVLIVLSAHVALFCIPYWLPGRYSWHRRITKTFLTVVPPVFTLVAVAIPYNPEWYGISVLFSWLSIPLYSGSIYLISHQTGMFIFVIKEIFRHSLVLLFVLVGFSLTFFVLYYEENGDSSKNFWQTFLYTTLVLLQGGESEDIKIFRGNMTTNAAANDGYLTYITEALSNTRFASIVASLLFLFIVIIALLNMLVALAIRGGDELRDYGQVYHLWSQTGLLYEWHEVKSFFRRCRTAKIDEMSHDQSYITIEHRNDPMFPRHELSVVAKHNNKKNMHRLTTNAMLKEILALLYEIQGSKNEY